MRLRDKSGNFVLRARIVAMATFGLLLTVMTLSSAVFAMSKQVSIVDGENSMEFTTFAKEIAEVLATKNIVLGQGDEVNYELNEDFPDGAKIVISRAVKVKILDGKNEYEKFTAKKTVGEALKKLGISLNALDIVSPTADSAVTKNMVISITRMAEEMVDIEEIIPYSIKKKVSEKLADGKTKVVQEGKEGLLKKTYKVNYKNGEEISRDLVETVVINEAVDKIVEYGVPAKNTTASIRYKTGTVTSRGEALRYRAIVDVTATAYDACYKCTGKSPGQRGYARTATGRTAEYGVIAVDPKVIPLGSRVYIESFDGSWTYGYAVAGDTGPAIKGNRVDLCMNSHSEATRFGRRSARIYILE